jgi:hypothetical protein
MNVQDLKRWHWIVIGLVVGLVVAYARAQMQAPPQFTVRHGLTVERFAELARQAARTPPGETAQPPLLNLEIYPPIDGKNYVTGQYLHRVRAGRPEYREFELNAPIPFIVPKPRESGGLAGMLERFRVDAEAGGAAEPSAANAAPAPDFTVRDYLAATAPDLPYSYHWWRQPSYASAAWIVGAVLVIGGVWPVVLNLMIGAGLAPRPAPEPAYDLDRFSREPEPAPAPASEVTEQDLAKLKALEAELERNLTASGGTSPPDSIPPADAGNAPPAGAPPRPLNAGPLEATPDLDRPGEPREYRGEYYPVAHPAHRKKDDPPA